MKKFLKITGITIGVLFLLLLILPFAFQGKIIEIVKREANSMLNAKLDFEKLSLSFIRNFPNASVSLKNISIIGINEFEGDTLIAAKEIAATINIKSLFGDSGYEIRRVLLDRVTANAMVLEDGKANWDIMKESETPEETPAEEAGTSSFKMQLKNVSIQHANLSYRDEQAKMGASVKDLNLTLSGDMTADQTTLQTNASIAALTFIMDKIPYLSNATVDLKMDVAADFQENKYTLKDNVIRLNALEATIDGWVAMLDNGFDMDIKLNTPAIDFKQILSLIPAIYAKDFEGVKASGNVTLAAAAKGKMIDEIYPSFDVKLKVDNARFQYPDLPKSVDNIAIDIAADNPGGDLDLTKVAVNKFHFEMAGNPFDLNLHLTTPISNATFNGAAHGKIDLGDVKDIYPLDEGMSLNGLLAADLSFAGNMKDIEKEQYENIKADGSLTLSNMIYKSTSLPDVLIDNAAMKFSPRYVEVNPLSVKIGDNDLYATGRLENFIPYAMKNETLKGSLALTSKHLNLNDFMSDSPETPETPSADTSTLTAFEIPKNIDFAINARLNEVLFDKLKMTNVAGDIVVKDGKLDMKNLSANSMGGTLAINGYYSTAKNPRTPETNIGIDIKNVSFAQAFRSFGMIQKFAPIFESLGGNFSMKLNVNTLLDEHLSPIYETFGGAGNLASNDVSISNITALNMLAKSLNNDKLSSFSAKDLNLGFTIEQGRLFTKPFDIKSGFGKMNISGSSGIDQTLDYVAKIDLPQNTLGGKLGQLTANVKIGGTFTNPKVSLDTKGITDQVTAVATEKLNVVKDSVTKKVSAEVTKQVEKIKEEARKAGENLVAEAEKQGQRLIDEANKTSNPLAKIAAVKTAEATAKKMKEEAQKKAQQLNDEAEKQAQKLVDGTK